MGHARGEGRDRGESGRAFLECVWLSPADRLALPVESTIDQRAILDLVKINADLGLFGGLIKMWLTSDADFESLSAQGLQRKLENTLSAVRLLQKKMSDRLNDL